ncbi:hypothetical protein [Allocoleopsis sp.]|uniref:hypothetical protein n=1 Tax=Allocoleopsis sp. TaxID=3088169 RepID=UPI002FD69BBF
MLIKTTAKAAWSFYRFLHFVATKGGLNSPSERSEVVNAKGRSETNYNDAQTVLAQHDPRRFVHVESRCPRYHQ